MSNAKIVKLIRELGIRPSKRLGQHYLIDEKVANRQIQYANISPRDRVLEIGPGLGILTKILSERARSVVAIEIDPILTKFLNKHVPNAEIIHGDALKVELPAFDIVISNIPFNISSPLTFRLLEREFKKGVIMYQKEFARRLVARKGDRDYSRLSISAYYRAECEILEDVPRTAFYPTPEVDSSIVKITPRNPPFQVRDESHFLRLVRALFNHRRKHISNSLLLEWRSLCDREELIHRVISRLPNPKARVEEMSPEEIGELSNWIVKEKLNVQ